ncbi:hypothetical protein L3081_02105 [Colwellia sp. MSW7]|uniref:DUF420 domain-containing protein n=1 Tax=Colwellia maritima TaxID=2912588 RepID=A0ABS9WWS7_9GAMM|nr:hypothetical protein [Colwellia maritima]MCI2282410.1 hypothetical protein [Colwellia maritima]
MSELSIEDWMAILFFIVLCTWGIATFLFRRISINHIEREMAKEGIDPPVWDKGIGSIIVTYSLIMVFPKLNPIIVDFAAVRRYTRKKDKKLAWFYFIVTVVTFVLMFTIAYLYGSES